MAAKKPQNVVSQPSHNINRPFSESVRKRKIKTEEPQISAELADEDQVVVFPLKKKEIQDVASLSPAAQKPKSVEMEQKPKEICSRQITDVPSTDEGSDFGDCSASLARLDAEAEIRQGFWSEQKPKLNMIAWQHTLFIKEIEARLSLLPNGSEKLAERLHQLKENAENQLKELIEIRKFTESCAIITNKQFDSWDKKLIVIETDKIEKQLVKFESEFRAIENEISQEIQSAPKSGILGRIFGFRK
ncbi:MAG TPA: hypothetical protein DCE71_08360 [Parachlamydiales bacterium]|nr:hypothetical protein [Parachlamydiales bacterium]